MTFEDETADIARDGGRRPLDNRTLWEQVRDRLREDVLAGRLAPGTELSEVALAREFGISRGPLREALGRLASEGLVTITPRRGAVVTQLSRQEFIDAYQVREALETLAVRLAVPLMSDAERAHLHELCELMARAARDNQVRLFFDTNNSFHEALVRASRNQKLYEVHRVLVGQMAPYLPRSLELRGNLQRSVEEHEEILAAIDARDPDRASQLLAEHIEVPQRVLESEPGQALFREDPTYATDHQRRQS
jgi:DNA-binding GntR family transcriptional regulator